MSKYYRVQITKVVDGEKEKICDEKMENVAMIGDCVEENKVAEIIINTNILDIAGLLAVSSKLSQAAFMATTMKFLRATMSKDPEDTLLDRLTGELH